MIDLRCLILGTLAALAANGAPLQFQSSQRQTALVELYTSEGCSSCPPAESWLSQLKEAPGLWSEFVPVAFHVDYWNYLGWRDKWARKEFSDRQRDYAQSWGTENIYTPEFVVNGQEWHGWVGPGSDPPGRGNKAGVLTVRSEGADHWRVSFASAVPEAASYEVHAALLVSGLGSEVKSGENAGRHLKHDFAVLTLITQPLVRKSDGFQGMFTMAAGQKTPEGRLALAVWTTYGGHLEALQAVGGWLAEPKKN
jgi:hypothetical protein